VRRLARLYCSIVLADGNPDKRDWKDPSRDPLALSLAADLMSIAMQRDPDDIPPDTWAPLQQFAIAARELCRERGWTWSEGFCHRSAMMIGAVDPVSPSTLFEGFGWQTSKAGLGLAGVVAAAAGVVLGLFGLSLIRRG